MGGIHFGPGLIHLFFVVRRGSFLKLRGLSQCVSTLIGSAIGIQYFRASFHQRYQNLHHALHVLGLDIQFLSSAVTADEENFQNFEGLFRESCNRSRLYRVDTKGEIRYVPA